MPTIGDPFVTRFWTKIRIVKIVFHMYVVFNDLLYVFNNKHKKDFIVA